MVDAIIRGRHSLQRQFDVEFLPHKRIDSQSHILQVIIVPGEVGKHYEICFAQNEEVFDEYSTKDTVGGPNQLHPQNESSLEQYM